jgi:hypothetical protein
MEVLEICRKKATIPVNPNPLMAAAFQRTHKEYAVARPPARAHLHSRGACRMCPEAGWYWHWRIIGTEEEMLSELVLKMAEKAIIDKAFGARWALRAH